MKIEIKYFKQCQSVFIVLTTQHIAQHIILTIIKSD